MTTPPFINLAQHHPTVMNTTIALIKTTLTSNKANLCLKTHLNIQQHHPTTQKEHPNSTIYIHDNNACIVDIIIIMHANQIHHNYTDTLHYTMPSIYPYLIRLYHSIYSHHTFSSFHSILVLYHITLHSYIVLHQKYLYINLDLAQ